MTLKGYHLHFSEEIHPQMHPNGEAAYALLARSDPRCLKIGPSFEKFVLISPLLTRVIMWDSTVGCQFYR